MPGMCVCVWHLCPLAAGSGLYCDTSIDGIGTCWPRSSAGQMVSRPCPEMFYGVRYNTTSKSTASPPASTNANNRSKARFNLISSPLPRRLVFPWGKSCLRDCVQKLAWAYKLGREKCENKTRVHKVGLQIIHHEVPEERSPTQWRQAAHPLWKSVFVSGLKWKKKDGIKLQNEP